MAEYSKWMSFETSLYLGKCLTTVGCRIAFKLGSKSAENGLAASAHHIAHSWGTYNKNKKVKSSEIKKLKR
jgi:hypothetical protein